MPDRPDYGKGRRPPPRRSWQEPDDQDQENAAGSARPSRPEPSRDPYGRSGPGAGQSRYGRGSGYDAGDVEVEPGDKTPIQSLSSGWGGSQKMSAEEKADLDKRNQKRLYKMLGNQTLCLIIIFSLISAFNWMASDFSGDYMGQSPELRTVRLIITRRAATTEAVLTYNNVGTLELEEGHGTVGMQDHTLSLYFVTPEKFRQEGSRIWRANFTGQIDNAQAVGTLTDPTGEYKVKLEKNLLTSLFAQLQGHIPRLPSIWTPSIFNERTAKPVTGRYVNQP